MKVLYEGKIYEVVSKDGSILLITDKNGSKERVDESEVIYLTNLNEYL